MCFLDEDWRKQIKDTRMIWGDDFSGELYSKKFIFGESVEGIYTDKIDSHINWFNLSPIRGGLIVGPLTTDEVNNLRNSSEELKKPLFMVR